MAGIINLFKHNTKTAFKVDTVDNNPILKDEAPEAAKYLQEIKLVDSTIRCCALKDVAGNFG